MADDHDTNSIQGGSESPEAKSLVVSSGFEFVLMGADGALDKAGISQIRAHTTRELHRSRRQNGQALSRRRRNRPGNIFFGSQLDPFHNLPHLPMEDERPGVLDEIKHNVFSVYGQKVMKQFIWPRGTRDKTFFTGMLLMSSVHLDSVTRDHLSPVTMTLKLEAMRLVRERIQQPTDDAIISCISAIACLATCALVRTMTDLSYEAVETCADFEQVRGGVEGAVEYMTHRNAYAILIKEANRLNMFQDSRFCKDVLRVITVIAISRRCRMPTSGLAPTLDSATVLKDYEHIFEDPWRSRTHPAPELYSPVYDGRDDQQDDPFPFVKKEHLRLLLQMMQSVIKIWLQQTKLPSQPQWPDFMVLDSLCQRIVSMPSSKVPGLPCSDDHVYEACRLISLLMVQSVEAGRSWKCMVQGTSMLVDIKEALQRTDLGSLWGDNVGLLYWIMLVYHCAAYGTADYALAHTILTNIQFEITYSYEDWHAALIAMAELKDVMIITKRDLASRFAGIEDLSGFSDIIDEE